MDEKKQIEEMAYDLCKYCLLKFGVGDIDKGIESCQFKDDCNTINKAKYLYEQGYRKLDDHAIMVLRKERGIKARIRKETAREIIRRIKRDYSVIGIINILEDLEKQYGVEVE